MNRSFFYRLALALLLVSILPFIFFLVRRETPPENLKVKTHKEQTIENFTLNSTGKNRWILKSPKAVFRGNNLVELKKPVFETLNAPKIEITAKEALLNREKGFLFLKSVNLVSNGLKAFSPEGIYFIETGVFKTDKGCELKTETSTTKGRKCIFYLKEGEVIIEGKVKSTIWEVK
ncbi:LPS export ABC transporter periplasmic protein LptC [Thermovibrio sp.]